MSLQNLSPKSFRFATWVHLILILAIALGICFRIIHLDRKVYWDDEVYTSLRISGYTFPEMVQEVYQNPTGQIITPIELQKYQQPNPERKIADTIHGLITEEPQLTPIYFILTRGWTGLLGGAIAITRSVSAIIGLSALPLMYLLCQELFNSTWVGWIGTAILAVSPFHVLYAQEARPYSILTVAILLSSLFFLRAIRQTQPSRSAWALYAVTIALGLYSHLFTAMVAFGHGVYLLIIERFRPTKPLIAFTLATLAGFLTLLPWMGAIAANQSSAQSMTNWAAEKFSLFSLISMWMGNISRILVDFGYSSDDPIRTLFPLFPIILGLLALVGYAFYYLIRQTQPQIWLFVITLTAITALILVLPDLILGGRRSGVARYPTATYLGIQLAIAYCLATLTTQPQTQTLGRRLTAFVLTCGVISCTISAPAQNWWNKGLDRTRYVPIVADQINRAKHPLVISDRDLIRIHTLNHELTPKTHWLLLRKGNVPQIPPGFDPLFLYFPSPELTEQLQQQGEFNFQPVPGTGNTLLSNSPNPL